MNSILRWLGGKKAVGLGVWEPHQFGVNFGVEPGVADEVDNPPLGLLRCHVELVRQHAAKREEECLRERGGGYAQQRASAILLTDFLYNGPFPLYKTVLEPSVPGTPAFRFHQTSRASTMQILNDKKENTCVTFP